MMIKKFSLNKVVVASVSLLLLMLFYFFPSNEIDLKYNITYEEGKVHSVYLLDKDGYVSKLSTILSDENKKELINNKLEILRDGDAKLKDFNPLIPKDAKIKNIVIEGDLVEIDFSNEILSIDEMLEEKMIEAIIYSITEIDGITKINLKVDGKPLNELPNSKKQLSYPLTREFGINKEYDITKTTNISKTTVYFVKENNEDYYYVPVTKVSNTNSEKIDIIISELKSSVNYQSNLYSFISNNLKLEDYELSKEAMNLIFNEFIFDNIDEENILEEVKYTISLSVLENYDVKEVIFSTTSKNNIESVSYISINL